MDAGPDARRGGRFQTPCRVSGSGDIPSGAGGNGAGGPASLIGGGDMSLDEIERRHIESILDRTGGHRIQASRFLGIGRRTLYRKLIKYGLKPASRDGGKR